MLRMAEFQLKKVSYVNKKTKHQHEDMEKEKK